MKIQKFNLIFPVLCISALLITSCQDNKVKEANETLPINKIEDINLSPDTDISSYAKYNRVVYSGDTLIVITVNPTDADNTNLNNNIKGITKQVNKLGYNLDKIDSTYITLDKNNYLQIKLTFERNK